MGWRVYNEMHESPLPRLLSLRGFYRICLAFLPRSSGEGRHGRRQNCSNRASRYTHDGGHQQPKHPVGSYLYHVWQANLP